MASYDDYVACVGHAASFPRLVEMLLNAHRNPMQDAPPVASSGHDRQPYEPQCGVGAQRVEEAPEACWQWKCGESDSHQCDQKSLECNSVSIRLAKGC